MVRGVEELGFCVLFGYGKDCGNEVKVEGIEWVRVSMRMFCGW